MDRVSLNGFLDIVNESRIFKNILTTPQYFTSRWTLSSKFQDFLGLKANYNMFLMITFNIAYVHVVTLDVCCGISMGSLG